VYCQVQGSNVHSSGRGWGNAAGDEIEIGPWQRGNVQVYRRCKVYTDHPVARWLDIFVNPSPTPQTLSVRIYSCLNSSVSQVITSSGQAGFGEKDWAFVTSQGASRPSLLHVVCGPRSKLRPTVRTSGNSIYVNYQVTMPANGTAVLCYFQSQGPDAGTLRERMKRFRASRLLRDVPGAVRKLIVNFRSGGALEQIDLERSGAADTVLLGNGDSIQGRITNSEFALKSLHGELKLPAGQVLGFVSVAGGEGLVRAVLVNGQVITGTLGEGTLQLLLPTGGELKIPYARIKQCAYRITKPKPEESPFTDPLLLLRNGDRLAFDAAALRCVLQTRHGEVPLRGKDLVEVRLDHEAHGVHRALFLNGSTLGGMLAPEKIALPIKLGTRLEIPREMVLALRFAAERAEHPALTRVQLSNEDELLGKLVDESYVLATDFGNVQVRPENVLSMAFDRFDPGRVAITLWDGKTTLRGRLRTESLRFAIQPGPVVKLHVGQVTELLCPEPLPPEDVVKEVRRHLARLSASSYKDREEAQEALIRMGRFIVPLLKKHLKDTDPEVRQRVRVILERLGADSQSRGALPAGAPFAQFEQQVLVGWGGPR